MEPLSKTRTLLYSAGSVGAGAFFAFNNFVLPQLLKAAGAGDLLTGLLSSTRSIEGVLIQPTVGALSDRTRSRLGRRRPFIVVGVPLSAAFFLFAAGRHDVLGLTVGIVLFSIFFNAAADPYVALLADITAPAERGVLSGVSTLIQLASQVGFLIAVSVATQGGAIPDWTYAAVAALLVLTFGVTVLGIREAPAGPRAPQAERVGLRAYAAGIAGNTQALRYLAAVFIFMVGFSAVLPYLTLFLTVDIHVSEQTALGIAAGTLLVTGVTAAAAGRLADQIGPKPVLAIGWALLAVAAFGGLFVRGLPETVAVVLVAGIGNGAATAVGWPLLALLIPADKTGVFAGLKAAAESVAIPASVFIAAVIFIPLFSYRGVFALLAATILLALAVLLRYVQPSAPSLPLRTDGPVG